jgi:undecaprenyl diphosphate synthase
LWPDFDEHELDTAIESFHLRERRFGKRNGEK